MKSMSAKNAYVLLGNVLRSFGHQDRMRLTDVARTTPDHVMEAITHQYGGLKEFCRNHPQYLKLHSQDNKIWISRRDVDRPTDIPMGPFRVETLASQRGTSALQLWNVWKPFWPLLWCVYLPLSEDLVVAVDQNMRVVEPWSVAVENPPNYATFSPHVSFAMQSYESCRVARHLCCDAFRSLADVEADCAALDIDVLLVALKHSERFTLAIGPDGAPHMKYVLSAKGREDLKPGKLDGKTMEELVELKASLIPRLKRKKRSFAGLKHNREIIKAMLRKKYPCGNPLLDPEVSAMMIYDMLPPNTVLSANEIRENILGDLSKLCCHIGSKFFLGFPHLFESVYDPQKGATIVRRRETDEPLSSQLKTSTSDVALINALVKKMKRRGDEITRVISVKTMKNFFPSTEHEKFTRILLSLPQVFPDTFSLTADKSVLVAFDKLPEVREKVAKWVEAGQATVPQNDAETP
jgi:hypothetical protein